MRTNREVLRMRTNREIRQMKANRERINQVKTNQMTAAPMIIVRM